MSKSKWDNPTVADAEALFTETRAGIAARQSRRQPSPAAVQSVVGPNEADRVYQAAAAGRPLPQVGPQSAAMTSAFWVGLETLVSILSPGQRATTVPDINQRFAGEFRNEPAYARGDMTEAEYVQMRRVDEGIDQLQVGSDHDAAANAWKSTDPGVDQKFAAEFQAEPRYAKTMSQDEFIQMRRVDEGIDELCIAR